MGLGRHADPIAVVEAAYATIEAPLAVWLRALAEASRSLDAGFGVTAGVFDARGPSAPSFEVAMSSATSDAVTDAQRIAYGGMPVGVRRTMCRHGVGFASDRVGARSLADIDGTEPMVASGIGDAFGVVGVDAGGRGVVLSAATPRGRHRVAHPIATWRRVASHLATAVRLRIRRGQAEVQTDAVLAADGFFVHAVGDAAARDSREELARAARCIDRARTRSGRSNPARALEVWTALVSGRWSLVDTVESDGRRLLFAHRNPTPGLTGGAELSQREAEVAALVAGGRSNKEIAYELGISTSTVETLVLRARKRIGAPTRAALAAYVAARS